MVGGSVAPPRLDLANEDLVRSHVQAIWLAETGQDLHGSLTDVLDVGGGKPTLGLLPKVRERLTDPAAARRAADRVKAVLAGMTTGAAYTPGLPGRREGDYIQRPRFIGIGEFGPGAVISHEGACSQVVSVALPPAEPGQEGTVTATARRCRDCGYLHPEAVGIDVCDHCDEPLRDTTRALLRLTSVRTARRARISSDEEERRRARFKLQTSHH